MKILVTGATGLIGTRLVRRLLEEGHDLTILTRNPAKSADTLSDSVRLEKWDTSRSLAPQIINSADAIIHLAGESIAKRWTEKHKERVLSSRVNGTRNLLANVGGSGGNGSGGPKVIISASAVGIYGDRGDELLSETSAPGKGFLSEVCKSWERSLMEAPGVYRRVSMRIGLVLAREGGMLPLIRPLFSNGLGGKLGTGKQYMSWVHIDDLIELFLFALRVPRIEGPLNAVAPNPVTNREFTATLGRVLRRPAMLSAPTPVLKLALGEMSSLLLEGQRVVPMRAADLGFQWRFAELEQALRDLCLKSGG